MQTERNRTCSKLLRCSLSYAKIMQTECNRACSKLLRCSLSYAKVVNFTLSMKYGRIKSTTPYIYTIKE